MRYLSTRGGALAESFSDALLMGLAGDGGLFVPETWPKFSQAEIDAFGARPYARSAARVLEAFGAEPSLQALQALCADAYARFTDAAVTPLEPLGPGRWLLNLHGGPTLAFKDIAMQALARLFDAALDARGRKALIVAATSGDTGGAAVEAFRGRANVRIAVVFPEGRISEAQRRFMTTAADDNVLAIAADGDFDACQAMVKQLFADRGFAQRTGLGAVNSINFARIAAQAVYYLVAAARLPAGGPPPVFAVPTGNFGDAFSAFAAGRMGRPMGKVLVATNANDILARALATGSYRRGAALATQSPAMDIQVASNFERLFFECSGRDADLTRDAFENFAARGDLQIAPSMLACARALFSGASVSEAETTRAIRQTWKRHGRLIDPHTAVAVAAASGLPFDADRPLVILATADPAKFPQTIAAACGVTPPVPEAIEALAAAPERMERLPADVGALKARLLSFARG
ncbi:MAG TPA: threonine synthase [Caulobacteraceae bacterium]|nr:threonine synthase [Caulobacteraceae bacterium]